MERKCLTIKETMEALLSGKKVASQQWLDGEYIRINANSVCVDEKGEEVTFEFNDEMFIYEEPKKKVELFLWAQYNGDDCYHTICNKFMDEDHAAMYLGKNAIKTNVSIVVEV